MTYFEPYLPASIDLLSVLAGTAVAVIVAAVGNGVTRCARPGGADLLAGFGLVGAGLALMPWFGTIRLAWILAALGLLAACLLFQRRDAWRRNELWRPFVLMLPALVVVSGVPLDEWDSFSHWGPNAAWLWHHGTLPRPDLPLPPSSHADYPYGFPFLIWALGAVRGSWVESAGAIINTLLLVGAATVLAQAASGFNQEERSARPWRYASAGLLLAFPLMPWIMRSTTLAAYADSLLAVATLVCVVELWRWLEARNDATGPANAPAGLLVVAVLGTAVACAKESGLLMLLVVGLSGILVVARSAGTTRGRTWLVAAGWILPGVLAVLAWNAWTRGWAPSTFELQPVADWHWAEIPELARAAGREVLDHGVFYAVVITAIVTGIAGWIRFDYPGRRFRALVALVILGHHGVLFLAYLGAGFSAGEVERAASFFRYGTQVGLLAVAGVASWVAEWLQRRDVAFPRWSVPVVVGLIVLASPHLHRDRTPRESFFLEQGARVAERLPDGGEVGIVGWRCDTYAFYMLRYAMYSPAANGAGTRLVRLERPAGQHDRSPRSVKQEFLLDLGGICLQPAGGADMLLFRRGPDGWREIGRWRIP